MMQSLPFVLVVLGVAVCAGAEGGALEDYVKHAEARFAWQKVEETNTNGFRITHLALTSQQWREYLKVARKLHGSPCEPHQTWLSRPQAAARACRSSSL